MNPGSPLNMPALIFDLGGVFIELTGVEKMLEWTGNRLTVEELWSIWFSSHAVKDFETGRLDAHTFAVGIIQDYNLPVDPHEFLVHFSSWSNQLYPGSRHLLTHLGVRYTLASLSNTNVIHWQNMCDRFDIDQYFHYNFPSHETGRIKPEINTFFYVIDQLSVPPDQIFFFDDNPDNVDSARQAGMNAFRVVGLSELNQTLSLLDLM